MDCTLAGGALTECFTITVKPDPQDYTPYVIPLTPVLADTPSRTNQSGSGLAYNGVRLDGLAPVDAILGCLAGLPGCASESGICDPSETRRRPPPPSD